jgi:hypothetical protein
MRERELTVVREAKESFAAADRALAAAAQGASPEDKRQRHFERERLGQLRALTEAGEKLLAALVAGEPVSAAPIADLGVAQAQAANDETRRRRR